MKPTITMHPVASSNIEAVGYDAGNQTLAIKFKGDRPPYHYSGVTAEDHAALMKADSIGSHHAKHIKGKFPHVVPDEELQALGSGGLK